MMTDYKILNNKRDYYEKKLKANPGSAELYYKYADFLVENLPEDELAIFLCVKALDINPDYLEVHRALCLRY